VIVEDGSSLKCDLAHKYEEKLSISYYYKENSGPGDSRNYGMKKSKEITLSYSIPIALFRQYLTKLTKP
jgi:glycosyltransferase involved in cell wall biosynthesis